MARHLTLICWLGTTLLFLTQDWGWNTVYLERAAEALAKSRLFDPAWLGHVSPLGWGHINLNGDYTWHHNKRVAKGGFRPLHVPKNGFGAP